VIALVYYKSGIQKFKHPLAFKMIMKQYRIAKLSETMLIKISLLVCCLELVTAAGLILPWARMIASCVGIILQIIFIIVLAMNYKRHFPGGCGCFEINTPETIGMKHIAMNASILTALVFNIMI